MKIHHIVLSLFLISFFSCKKEKEFNNKGGDFHITGKIANLTNPTLYLERLNGSEWVVMDTASADGSGNFEFSGKTTEPDYYLIKFNNFDNLMLILENTEVKIEADAKNLLNSVMVEGSKPTKEYLDFYKRLIKMDEQESVYHNLLPQLQVINNTDSLKIVFEKIEEIQDGSRVFVKHYIDSIFPSMAIFSMLNYLDPAKDFDYMEALATKMNKQMSGSKYTKMYVDEITLASAQKKQHEQKQQASKVKVGSMAPDIKLPDVNGKPIAISDYKGKYLLVDFWASWCGPCRAENPNVVNLYKKYHSKGFEVLGVSLDSNKKAWTDAIEKDGLPWQHISELKAWNSYVVPLYEITGIPATYLLDKEGKIIASNLRGSKLEEKLESIFFEK